MSSVLIAVLILLGAIGLLAIGVLTWLGAMILVAIYHWYKNG